MPKNYTTIKGDTQQKLGAKFYGDRSQGSLIQSANPGIQYVDTPITSAQKMLAGQDIIIPDLVEPVASETPQAKKTVSLFNTAPESIGFEHPDEIAILINGKMLKYFNAFNIKFGYDKLADEFSFGASFDADNPEHRAAFKGVWQPTVIYIGGQPVITGQSFAQPTLTTNNNTVLVKGYSITGNLLKNALTEKFEFEETATFEDIIVDVCRRVGIAVVIDKAAKDIAAKPFEQRVVFSPTEAAGAKLTQLARDRGLILSDTFNGRILVTKPKLEGAIVQAFVEGDQPSIIFNPTYNAEALSTKYIGYAPEAPDESTTAENNTIDGLPMPGILPRVSGFQPRDVDNIGIEDAVRAERGRSYAAWLSANIQVDGWRDSNGNLYQPNTLISVRSPGVFIYEDTLFLVRDVSLLADVANRSATLELILPEALSGKDLKIVI